MAAEEGWDGDNMSKHKKETKEEKKINTPFIVGIVAVLIVLALIIKSCSGPDLKQKHIDLVTILMDSGLYTEARSDGKEVIVVFPIESDATPTYLTESWFYIFGTAAGIYDEGYTVTVQNVYDEGSSIDVSAKISDINRFLDEKMTYKEFSEKLKVSVTAED